MHPTANSAALKPLEQPLIEATSPPVSLISSLRLQTISFDEAAELTEAVCSTDFQSRDQGEEGIEALVRLLVGLASYEDHEYRQICLEHALYAVLRWTDEGRRAFAALLDRALEEGGDDE